MALSKVSLPTQQNLAPMSMVFCIAARTQRQIMNASFTKCCPTSARTHHVLVSDFVGNWREPIHISTNNWYASTNSRFPGVRSEANTEVKLIGKWSSHYVTRVKIALNIKSIEYENIEDSLNPKSKLLLKSNPVYARVPVLIHDDRPICESLVILEYIDETWPTAPSLLPSHPYDRAVARFWAAYIDDKCFPSIKNIMAVEGEEERKRSFEVLEEVLERVEGAFRECSKGKPFFAGDTIGFLDIVFGCFLGWLSVLEHRCERKVLVEAKAPALVKWAERFAADPAVKGLIPDTLKLADLSNDLFLQYNPAYKKILVLLHNDKPICEYGIIVEYTDEVWPSGLIILPLFLCMRNIIGAEDDEAKKL
ncbi:Glutathione S-transferase U18, partial [Mucuna pruriens]